MRKKWLLLLFVVLLVAILPSNVIAAQPITVTFNGKQLQFEVPPLRENGRVLVPFRDILEALGAIVDWDGTTRTVTAIKDNDTIKLIVGKNVAYKNGATVELDVPSTIVEGRTLVPVRFVSETFGANVRWDGEKNNVTISYLKGLLANSASNIKNFVEWAEAIYSGEPNPESANKWIAEQYKQVEGSYKAIQNHYQFFKEEWGDQINNDTVLQAIESNYQQAIKYMSYHTVVNAIFYDHPDAHDKLQKIAELFLKWSNSDIK
ncbi:copper amine oxidase N-terminal domain-containing protein [Neomoorella thermoacetica]|uniref:copper amine oxidase N-terminal domain-containing protein n=1 Tax=Neomoorella thermoacetica TaxID=1525 RepID=UPI0008FB83C6|nr:copper amine oxidase N-terminal domain-containing protein [Moorella thermoacetica]OIQ61630.1 primary amine oxidase precursor [Moorella thermoacetica]